MQGRCGSVYLRLQSSLVLSKNGSGDKVQALGWQLGAAADKQLPTTVTYHSRPASEPLLPKGWAAVRYLL